MLKVLRPKFSVKEHIIAWAERKGFHYDEYQNGNDSFRIEISKPIDKDRWFFSGKYTSYDKVLSLYFYNKIGKKAAEALKEDNLEGKKLFWLKVKPAYFNIVEVLAEEIDAELEDDDKKNKIILVTMEK